MPAKRHTCESLRIVGVGCLLGTTSQAVQTYAVAQS
jgi:hypothetical protein